MKTTEKKAEIDRFMGLQTGRELGYDRWHQDWFDNRGVINGQRNDKLLFHSDWNWLMGVVERIQLIPSCDKDKFGTIVKIEGRNCSIKSDNYRDKNKNYSKSLYFNANYSGKTKIEAVYEAVYQFVVWYNQNKDNESQMY